MLAKTLGIIQPLTNQTTGVFDLYLMEKDEFDLPKRTKLGKNLTELSEALDPLVAPKFEEAVEKRLVTTEYQHQDKRSALMAQIRQDLDAVLAERRGNVEDATYIAFE